MDGGVGFPFTRKVEGIEKGRGDWGREDFSYYHAMGKEGAQRINRATTKGSVTEKKTYFSCFSTTMRLRKSSFGTRFPPKNIFIYIFFLFPATVPTTMMHGKKSISLDSHRNKYIFVSDYSTTVVHRTL